MKHFLELLVNPYLISMFFLVLSSVFLLLQVYTRFVRIIVPLATAALLLLGSLWLPDFLSEVMEDTYSPVTKVDPNIKWVVVLAGGQYKSSKPSNSSLTRASISRLVEGVRLYRMLPNSKLLLSGGGFSPWNSEAEKMAVLTNWFDIPKSRIFQDRISKNTKMQAKALKSIIGNQPFYLVTSAVHMPRAMYLCKRLGLNPIPAPTDYYFKTGKLWLPDSSNITYITSVLHELLGSAWAYTQFSILGIRH